MPDSNQTAGVERASRVISNFGETTAAMARQLMSQPTPGNKNIQKASSLFRYGFNSSINCLVRIRTPLSVK